MIDLETRNIERLRRLVEDAERVVITCHIAPDGDAMGSTLALWHLLNAMGKRPAVITPDVPTRTLMFLPGAREIIAMSRNTEKAMVHIQAADLIVCLDFNTYMRIDKMQPYVEKAPAPKVLIDHHLNPDIPAEVTFSRPNASSTCYLLYEIIKAAGWKSLMTAETAECIYTGMMTDTGNFSYNSNDPGLYRDVAELVEMGINKDAIYKLACDTASINQLKLNAYAICEKMTVFPEHRAALIALSREELTRYCYAKGDTEGLVNKPLSVPEIVCSVFLREDEDMVKVSMRSKGSYPVNLICSDHFGGGGHLNAAGGELYCSLDEAIAKVEAALPQYDNYLPENQ